MYLNAVQRASRLGKTVFDAPAVPGAGGAAIVGKLVGSAGYEESKVRPGIIKWEEYEGVV